MRINQTCLHEYLLHHTNKLCMTSMHLSTVMLSLSYVKLFLLSLSLFNLQEVTLTFGGETIIMKDTFKRLVITFQTELLQVLQDKVEPESSSLYVTGVRDPGFLETWREGRLAFGGLLGEVKH